MNAPSDNPDTAFLREAFTDMVYDLLWGPGKEAGDPPGERLMAAIESGALHLDAVVAWFRDGLLRYVEPPEIPWERIERPVEGVLEPPSTEEAWTATHEGWCLTVLPVRGEDCEQAVPAWRWSVLRDPQSASYGGVFPECRGTTREVSGVERAKAEAEWALGRAMFIAHYRPQEPPAGGA